jgi:phosphoglycerate dehydrogenase-like enzyme
LRILVADALSDAGVAALAEHHDVDVKTGLPKDELLGVIGAYDGVVVRSATTIDADVIAAGTNLKVIARAGLAWTTSTSRQRPATASSSATPPSPTSSPPPSTRSR